METPSLWSQFGHANGEVAPDEAPLPVNCDWCVYDLLKFRDGRAFGVLLRTDHTSLSALISMEFNAFTGGRRALPKTSCADVIKDARQFCNTAVGVAQGPLRR